MIFYFLLLALPLDVDASKVFTLWNGNGFLSAGVDCKKKTKFKSEQCDLVLDSRDVTRKQNWRWGIKKTLVNADVNRCLLVEGSAVFLSSGGKKCTSWDHVKTKTNVSAFWAKEPKYQDCLSLEQKNHKKSLVFSHCGRQEAHQWHLKESEDNQPDSAKSTHSRNLLIMNRWNREAALRPLVSKPTNTSPTDNDDIIIEMKENKLNSGLFVTTSTSSNKGKRTIHM